MNKSIPVICHDFRAVVTGTLTSISENGCELISSTQSTGPVFPQKTKVLLNLLDEKTGQTMNVRARLVGAKRHKGAWTYKIRWPETPKFLAA